MMHDPLLVINWILNPPTVLKAIAYDSTEVSQSAFRVSIFKPLLPVAVGGPGLSNGPLPVEWEGLRFTEASK